MSDGIANPECPRCRGFGELCNDPCGVRIAQADEDIRVVAQYAKTYGDGQVREAACRILARSAA